MGILELAFIAPGADLVRRSLELFGTEVPRASREFVVRRESGLLYP